MRDTAKGGAKAITTDVADCQEVSLPVASLASLFSLACIGNATHVACPYSRCES